MSYMDDQNTRKIIRNGELQLQVLKELVEIVKELNNAVQFIADTQRGKNV